MNTRTTICALAALLFCGDGSAAQTPVMRDGHPALECAASTNEPFKWSIQFVDLDGRQAFQVPLHFFSDSSNQVGTLYATEDRLVFKSQRKPEDSFDENRDAVRWRIFAPDGREMNKLLELQTDRVKHKLAARDPGGHFVALGAFPACVTFLELVLSDFTAAEKQFNKLTRNLPQFRETAWREFQPKAAAWRALATKPPLSPEADKHWILAENAFKEKNLDSAAEHYEAALEIQPTWPAGWFDLAMIYAEQNHYADASDAMKHYLELVPDASNAGQAREQMVIWEDKAKQ